MNSTTWMYYWRVFIWMVRLCANGRNNSQQYWDLQCIMGRIKPISLCKPCVWACVAQAMLEELCKQIQHCCATLRRSGNKRNVGSCWLKSLIGFKLCATTRNNIQQGVQTDATCNTQQCWELLANNVASVCSGLNTIGFHPQTQNWSEPDRKKVPFESTTEEV